MASATPSLAFEASKLLPTNFLLTPCARPAPDPDRPDPPTAAPSISSTTSPFAYKQHFKSIFKTNQPGPSFLHFLDGIRVLSMAWVHLGHVFIFYLGFLPARDAWKNAEIVRESIPHHVILGGTFAVDTFFFLSGLLAAYQLSKGLRKIPIFSTRLWVVFTIILQRFLRLVGPVLFLLAFTLIQKPEWGADDFEKKMIEMNVNGRFGGCRQYWWSLLLLVNNVASDGSGECLGWTWYLANDWQFFLVAMVVLLIYTWNQRAGVIAGLCILAISLAASLVIAVNLNISATIDAFGFSRSGAFKQDPNFTVLVMQEFPLDRYFFDFYIAPWVRIQAYMVGLFFGMYISHKEAAGELLSSTPCARASTPSISGTPKLLVTPTPEPALPAFSLTRTAASENSATRSIFQDSTKIHDSKITEMKSPSTSSRPRNSSRRVSLSLLELPVSSYIVSNPTSPRSPNPAKGKLGDLKVHWSWQAVVFGGTTTLVMLPYLANIKHPVWSSAVNALYVSWSRALWAVCVAGLSFLAVSGNLNGVVHRTLSSCRWVPFARLSYAFYLMHPLVLGAVYGAQRNTLATIMTWDLIGYYFLTTAVFTLVISLVVYVFVETPLKLLGYQILNNLMARNKAKLA